MSEWRASGRGLRLATAVGAVGLAAVGFGPTLAFAAGNPDTLTVAGGSSYTYTFNQSPSIKAVAQPNCLNSKTPITVSISGPGVVNPTLASAARDCVNPVSLSPSASEVNTAGPAWSGGVPAMNGVYTVVLDNEGRTTVVNFTLLIPPAPARGFAVATSGSNATFTWIKNAEPDISSYDITDPNGNTLAAPTTDCTGGSCSTGPVNLGSSVVGHTEKFSIVAVRSCGTASCSAGHLVSSASTASGTFTTPRPSPKPTPSPTGSGTPSVSGGGTSGSGGGGTSGSGSGSGSGLGAGGGSSSGSGALRFGGLGVNGGTPSHHHRSHALSGGVLPALGLPTLPGGDTSTQPLHLGKPGGKIAYPAPIVADKQKSTVRSISHVISSSFSSRSLWQGIGAGAVLLLLAFHIRTWAGRETY